MSGTLANNITKEIQAPHACAIFLSDSVGGKGDQISETYALLSVAIVKTANKIAFAKILISDGSVPEQDFLISNTEDFVPGKFITIEMGDANGTDLIFKGIIVKHGIKIRNKRKSILTLDCRDITTITTSVCKNKYFDENTTDSDAFDEIIKKYKSGISKLIKTDFEDTETEHEGLVQYNCTDWDFILTRANAAGQLVFTDNGLLTTLTPTVADEAEYTLEWGDKIVEFEAEMDVRNQFDKIELNSWDSSKQALINEELNGLDGIELDQPGNINNSDLAKKINSEGLKIQYPGYLNAGDTKHLAKAELIKSKLARIQGRVSFTEATIVKPNATIELKGVGDRFNGLTYITGVRYEFVKNVWTTDLQFGLSRDWFKENSQKSSVSDFQIPPMSGLHIGVVTRLDDELGEDRIKVRIPTIDEKSEGIWAKIARPDAGEHRGFFFLPELDDEVLIGFLSGDPRYPIIVGMLNSSAKPAPVKAEKKDNLKGYYSKKGSRLEFDDKKSTLKIQTLNSGESDDLKGLRSGEPKLEDNNTIFMDDEKGEILIQDKNKNYIKFSEEEILIFGEKKIILEAKEVIIKADTKLEAKTGESLFNANGEIKMVGATINLNP